MPRSRFGFPAHFLSITRILVPPCSCRFFSLICLENFSPEARIMLILFNFHGVSVILSRIFDLVLSCLNLKLLTPNLHSCWSFWTADGLWWPACLSGCLAPSSPSTHCCNIQMKYFVSLLRFLSLDSYAISKSWFYVSVSF